MTSLFQNATEGILLTNSKGQIILVNPATERLFGYTSEELKGEFIEMLLPGDVRDRHIGMRDGFYKHPQNREMGSGRDLFASKKDGSVFPVEVSLSHYKKDGETFVIAFVVDISKRMEMQENLVKKQKELEQVTSQIRKMNTELEHKVDERTFILKEALEKLEQSQKELKEALDKERQLNEIKSRFVSMASHEFRTPLSAVLSSASLLSKYIKEEEQEKRDRHINRIKNSVKHLNDILEDFLSLGRLDEGRTGADPSSFNVKETIAETISDMKLHLKAGQFFSFEFEGIETQHTDKKLLKNILINLLSNAIKFSGEGTEIKLKCHAGEEDTSICIIDQGIGISEKDQQHLFSSFFRGTNANNIQGTGLGLHIVKRYIDLLGGTVNLQSKQNIGTRIEIKFPGKN
ncbi:MAG TPA: PAS domain-containing sensor histidine kinase [Chitinophagaceae bacterium]|nr:PAS domain-containing sensor histidine kinase [Chitinophagaceae bacterium]